MKIAIIGSEEFDSLEFHLNDELTVQGHTTKIFNFSKIISQKIDLGLSLISSSFVSYLNTVLLKKVLNYNPDLVIVIYRHVHPDVVKQIKKNKIKIIHLNPDALTTFQNQQIFAEAYDKYYTKDPYIFGFIKNKLGYNVELYSEAFNPRFHNRPNTSLNDLEDEIDIDVLCFGNLYPYRNRMLHQLKDEGFALTLYGNKAKYFDAYLAENYMNRGIYGAEKSKILNGSKIVFNNFHYAEIESVNNKFFEINGSGAFQICDYKPILHDVLPIDPKLVSFENIDQSKKLIKKYLNEKELRHEIRDKIYNHFTENYTYSKLINQILNN